MSTGFHNSTLNARGMGMEKKSKDQEYLIEVNRGGAQHIGSGESMEEIHKWFMLWG